MCYTDDSKHSKLDIIFICKINFSFKFLLEDNILDMHLSLWQQQAVHAPIHSILNIAID